MKGIALETIALFFIAIVSIVLLISFMGFNVPKALREGYCYIARGLLGFLPLPEHAKPSLPHFCKETIYQQLIYIESELADRISYEIASYVMACWEKTGRIGMAQNANCFEIVIRRVNGVVNENSVKANLPERYRDLMSWRAGEIDRPKSLGIIYDAGQKLVVVV